MATEGIIPNLSVVTQASSVDERSEKSRKGISTLRKQTAEPRLAQFDPERQIHAQASEDTEQHSTQATLATSSLLHSEIVPGLPTVTQASVQMSLKKKTRHLEHSLAFASQKFHRLTHQNVELRQEIESLKRDRAEERADYDSAIAHSIRNLQQIHRLRRKIESLEMDKDELTAQMEENEKLMEKRNVFSGEKIASLQNQIGELQLALAQKQQEVDSLKENFELELLKIERERDQWQQQSLTSRKRSLEIHESRAFQNLHCKKRVIYINGKRKISHVCKKSITCTCKEKVRGRIPELKQQVPSVFQALYQYSV